MPLVRISLMKSKLEGFGKSIGEIVYRTMVDTMTCRQRIISRSLPSMMTRA
jgi:hypothetical protein